MKYIRTKDGIYEIKIDTYIQDNILWQSGYDFGRINLGEVINQADTIEELCDEFVIVFEDGHIMTDLDYESFGKEWYKNKHIRMRNAQYYGAIWTDKGLIYVAKMDADGKLVLI